MPSVTPAEVKAASKPSVPQFTVTFIESIKAIEVTIKNQPYTPYTNADGYKPHLYYTIQIKEHFSPHWQTFGQPAQSDDQYTIAMGPTNCVAGTQIYLRVEARIGYKEITFLDGRLNLITRSVVDASSGWSEIQTFTIPNNSLSGSPSQTANLPENPPATPDNNQPQTPNFVFNPLFLLGISVLFGGVVVVAVLIFTRHYTTPQTSNKQQTHKTPSYG